MPRSVSPPGYAQIVAKDEEGSAEFCRSFLTEDPEAGQFMANAEHELLHLCHAMTTTILEPLSTL
jgi:hypothetical protein